MGNEPDYKIIDDLGGGFLAKKIGKDRISLLKLRIMQWYDGKPMFDLRWWNGDIPGKGITLTAEALKNLRDAVDKIEFEEKTYE